MFSLKRTLLSGLVASTLALGGGAALAQDAATPEASPAALATPSETDIQMSQVGLVTADGQVAGYAQIWEGENGVTITVTSTEEAVLQPGTVGIHIHETGTCDADGNFESAGGHFNPTDGTHGAPDADDSHAGDLGNLEVAEDGSFAFQITTDKISIDPSGENTLAQQTGTSLVIHAGEDDLTTDPSGDSGDRVACGVIFKNLSEATDATPVASPEATPAN